MSGGSPSLPRPQNSVIITLFCYATSMAVKLLINSSMTLTDPTTGVNQTFPAKPGIAQNTPRTVNNSSGVMTVPITSGGTAIPLGTLSVNGYALFQNLDNTNTINILNQVGGSVVIAIMKPGQPAGPFFLGVPAPAAISLIAPCEMSYAIMDGS